MRDNGCFDGWLGLVVYAVELIYAATEPGSVVDGGDEEFPQRLHFDYRIQTEEAIDIYRGNKNEK